MDRKSALLIRKFNAKLNDIIDVDIPVLKKIKKFVIESGGKRIRPLTHYYFARILSYKGEECLDVGAIGELIHAASLLHDDVVDDGLMRRGKPTINSIYGNKTAVLSGDYLLACGLDHLGTLPHANELLSVFTRVIRDLSVGELLQMEWESNFNISEKMYERIIRSKTATLFGAMTESAAILAGLDRKDQMAHRDFGIRLGRIFQIRDDYLDYFGDAVKNGKENYQDFKRGLITRPIIVLRSCLKGRDSRTLKQTWLAEDRRMSDAGLALWSELSRKANLDERLAGEIDKEIGTLMKFLSRYPEGEFSRLISRRITDLAVAG